MNQHEFLRVSTRKRSKKKKDLLLMSNSEHLSSGADSDGGEGETTKTHDLYSKLLKHPDFLWTMQPRLYDAPSDSEEED